MKPREIVIEYVDECFWDECEKEIKKLINEKLEEAAVCAETAYNWMYEQKANTQERLNAVAREIRALKEPQQPDGFATTEELAKALGSSDEEAKRIQTRVEYLAGNKPSEYEEPQE